MARSQRTSRGSRCWRRTPFAKAGRPQDVRAVDLGRYAARELLERTNLDGDEVDEVRLRQVVPSAPCPTSDVKSASSRSFRRRFPPTR